MIFVSINDLDHRMKTTSSTMHLDLILCFNLDPVITFEQSRGVFRGGGCSGCSSTPSVGQKAYLMIGLNSPIRRNSLEILSPYLKFT